MDKTEKEIGKFQHKYTSDNSEGELPCMERSFVVNIQLWPASPHFELKQARRDEYFMAPSSLSLTAI